MYMFNITPFTEHETDATVSNLYLLLIQIIETNGLYVVWFLHDR